ncbi:MAG: hypothetical protein N839_0005245 [Desulfofustis sp. PB-SRB1]|mgnify:CR=1 FL=1|jgi:hypothetical protein|nr:hypothetical protein [Desulfofustis sp. PB-SRB1]MBM1001801.1 hypothetical protein [Desulfofustis sp. PB-SRB1]
MIKSESISERKEDFFVQASLDILGKEIQEVPCKIYLPESTMDKPYFWFRPSKIQFDILSKTNKTSFSAVLDGFNSKKEVTIISPEVYLSSKSTRYWGPNSSESTLKGEPQNLKVVQVINLADKIESNRGFLNIWISPNSLLEPILMPQYHYHGDIKYDRVGQIEFEISENLIVTFDKHFKTATQKNGDLKQSSFLVGCAEVDSLQINDTKYENEIMSLVDNFLMVASLGSRTRTACLGWEIFTNNHIVKFYRSEISFPSGKSEFLINCAFPEDLKGSNHTHSLIDRSCFQDYLKTCFPALLSYPNPEILCDAIVNLVPGRKRTIEESFLSMFSSLESLILDFRKRNNLEYVIADEEEWKSRKKEMHESVTTIMKNYSGEQRSYVYGKLDELNRIPLRIVFEKFCSEYNINVSDLWPLFRVDGIIGLSDIRNKLIHGDIISNDYIKMLSEANSSLQYMLERVLLTILEYPIDKSDVSKTLLFYDQFRLNWTVDEQIKFTDYIDNL